jgi:hypothetical protein
MITEPTVLILGAGASSDYGFPLGRGLRNDVCDGLGPRYDDVLTEAGFDAGAMKEFVNSLRHSGYSSVDWFLEDRPEFIDVGKAAIAAALIPRESPDRLFPPLASENHWYELLVNTLDDPLGAFAENHLSIVTFNYDRSLEYYLFRVLENRLRSERLAVEALNSFDVIHVHGALGALTPLVDNGRPYSPTINPEAIRTAAEQIIIVGEASEGTEPFERARHKLQEAKRIVFLGFGFHRESVRRLGVFNEPWDDEHRQRVRVGGTTRGIPQHTWLDIQENILNGAYPPRNRKVDRVYKYLNETEPLGS